MTDVRRFGRPFARDFHTHSACSDLELFDPDGHAHHPRIGEQKSGDPIGKRLDKRNMLVRDDHPDAVGDHVVREYVAHVRRRAAKPEHCDVDVEAHVLRLLVLPRIGADADRKHEIADKTRSVAASFVDRVSARCQQAVVDFRRRRPLQAGATRIGGNQPRIIPTTSGSIRAARSCSTHSARRKPR